MAARKDKMLKTINSSPTISELKSVSVEKNKESDETSNSDSENFKETNFAGDEEAPEAETELEAKKGTPLNSEQPTLPSKDLSDGITGQSNLKIMETETGWLNVRSEPSLGSKILTKVNVGEEFEYTDKQDNWYKIILDDEDKMEGWVFGEYIEEVQN